MSEEKEETQREGLLTTALNLRVKKFIVMRPEAGFKNIRSFVRAAVEEKLTKLKAEA